MVTFVLRRTAFAAVVLVGVTFAVFLVLHAVPGDPVLILLGENFTEEGYDAWRRELGLDRPFLAQYVHYIRGVLSGDWGMSFRTRSAVANSLAAAIPPTVRLTFAALLVSVLLGVPAGIVSAVKRGTVFDKAVMALAILGVSAPYFWVALLLMYVFSLQLGWFPSYGDRGLASLVLPAVTLGMNYAAMLARLTRTSMLDVLGMDFVRTARSKGVSHRTVIYKHALRNAALPIVTLIGLQLGALISGALIVEVVFAWPGMGRFLIVAVEARDIPSVQGAVLVMGVAISGVNLAVDLLYAVLDPRIRYS